MTTTPTPTQPTVVTPTPTVTPIPNAATDVARFEQIKSQGMAYITLSPQIAEMMLTDSQGRRLGYDPFSREDINEFFVEERNFSFYTRYDGVEGNYSNSINLAPLQAWGTVITFTITGLEPGNYELVGVINDGYLDRFPMFIFSDTIQAGEIQTKTIYIPPSVLQFADTPPRVQAGPDLTIAVGEPITFTGSFTDTNVGDTHQISWDFGDGSTAQDTLTPSHTYMTSGIYTVTLKVAEGFVYVRDTLQVTVR